MPTEELPPVGGSTWNAFTKTIKDNLVPIAAVLTLGVVAPAVGKYFLRKGLLGVMEEPKFRLSNAELEPIIAKAKVEAGLGDMPHKQLPLLENAFYVPPNSIPDSASGDMHAKIRSNLASGTRQGKAMGELLQTVSDYSHSPQGGIIIGQKLSNPQIVAHELGHAKIEHDGGIEYYIQKYAPSLQTVGALTTLGSLIPSFLTGNKDLGWKMFGAGMGMTGAGLGGKLYSEYKATQYGKDIVNDIKMDPKTRELGNKALNYALGTYINNAVGQMAPVGVFTKGLI